MPTSLSLWQLNLIPLGSFRVLMPIFLNSTATKPGHLKTIPGSHADCFSILRQLNLVTETIPGSHAELSSLQLSFQWQLNQGH